jgi:hypothetical protein
MLIIEVSIFDTYKIVDSVDLGDRRGDVEEEYLYEDRIWLAL